MVFFGDAIYYPYLCKGNGNHSEIISILSVEKQSNQSRI